MKKSIISKLIVVILKLLFIFGIISLLFIPKIYNLFPEFKGITFESQTILYQIAFYIGAIVCLTVIYVLIRIFNNIYKESPFKKEIEISLKIIAILFMILSLIITIKIIFIPTLLSIVVAFITFIVSLCFYELSQIFKVAIEYKNEVDLMV